MKPWSELTHVERLSVVDSTRPMYLFIIDRLRQEHGFKGKDDVYMYTLAGDILRGVGLAPSE